MAENKELKNEDLEKVSGGEIDAEGDDIAYEFTSYFDYSACCQLIGKLIKYKSTNWFVGSGKGRVTSVGTGDANSLELDTKASVVLGWTDARVWVLNEETNS